MLAQISVTTPAAAAGANYACLRAPTRRSKLRELSAFLNAATASSIGLIRITNTPVATTTVVGQALDPADPTATTTLDTAWSTAPTFGTSYLTRAVLPNVAGNGIIWVFSDPIILTTTNTSWLAVVNFGGAAGSALSLTAKWEE
jgi:hypothetical protein